VNVRHLETFYHVARNGGINRAVGRTPYGIQQSAISEQIRSLEDHLGCRLFERQPFRLTAEGDILLKLAQPFFENLAALVPRLRGGLKSCIRIAAAEVAVQHYLPPIVRSMRELDPNLRLTFRSGTGGDMKRWLQEGEVDLVITSVPGRAPVGIASRMIVALPLLLIVNKTGGIRSAERFWSTRDIVHPLICPADAEGISQTFRRGLERGGIRWPTTIVASSVSSVTAFVASGEGVGVSLDLPCLIGRPDIRVLPLQGFDPVPIAALWRPPDTSKLKSLLGVIMKRAQVVFDEARMR